MGITHKLGGKSFLFSYCMYVENEKEFDLKIDLIRSRLRDVSRIHYTQSNLGGSDGFWWMI